MNKKSQQISINFLVMFILAIVVFSLGVILMWRIFYSGSELTGIAQGEFDKRISALNCKPSETVCVGLKKLVIQGGDNLLIDLRIFNNHNDPISYDVKYQLKDSQDDDYDDEVDLLPKSDNVEISAKDDQLLSVMIVSGKRMKKGDYALRVVVDRPGTGLDPIIKRVYFEVK